MGVPREVSDFQRDGLCSEQVSEVSRSKSWPLASTDWCPATQIGQSKFTWIGVRDSISVSYDVEQLMEVTHKHLISVANEEALLAQERDVLRR